MISKTILLTTVMAVSILGLTSASMVFNTPAEADHGDLLQVCLQKREGQTIIYDPNTDECIPNDECPNGRTGDPDRPSKGDHCLLINGEPEPTGIERVSETISFHDNFKLDKEGTVLVLLDTTGSGTLAVVHVAANLPCNDDGEPNDGAANDTPDVSIVAGVAGGSLTPVIDSGSTDQDTGFAGPGKTCVFHATLTASDAGHDITDVIVINTSSDDVDLKNSIITITGTYE